MFAATYNTNIDWTPEFALPALARNMFNLTPSVSLQNVDPGPFWVASERTNGQYVHQSKRLTLRTSASPTIFGLFRGVRSVRALPPLDHAIDRLQLREQVEGERRVPARARQARSSDTSAISDRMP